MSTSSMSVTSPSSRPNSNFVSAMRIPRSRATVAPYPYSASARSLRTFATSTPTSASTSSNVIGRSCPASAFDVGVNSGAGNSSH